MAQIGITSKETELYPVLESNSKNEGLAKNGPNGNYFQGDWTPWRRLWQRMAQIGITSKETELHPVLESNSKNEGFGKEWPKWPK